MATKEKDWDVERLLRLGWLMKRRPERLTENIARYLRIRDRDGSIQPLRANQVQLDFEKNYGQRNIVLKARQMGITTWVAARYFLKTITARGILSVQVAHTREAAEGIFRMVQRFWECLPAEMRKGPVRRSRANVGQMCFPELDSEFRILSAGDVGTGRGLTIQYLHCSELSRWPGPAQETLAGLRAALSPRGELVMESTPNGASGCFYEEWGHAATNGTACHFFPWWMESIYVSESVTNLTEKEQELIQIHGLTAQQIGFRRSLETNYQGLRVQEFAEDPESCFKTSGECCFDSDSIERRLAEVSEPVATERGGALHVWYPALPAKQYLIAVDTAGGGADGDFAAVQVIELVTGLQCAELQQRLGTLELARVAASLARRYNGAIIAVERNNHGAGVLAYLDSSERYANVYGAGGAAGWLTSVGNKPGMVSRIGALLVESPQLFSSRRLLKECRTFISMEGGRTGAASGAHDDCLMAMAIAQAVRAELVARSFRRMMRKSNSL
ncbi:MAG: terminase [Acidobacteriaceae bacterium]|nr:terminase [Acidobacteriaceae bacterium]